MKYPILETINSPEDLKKLNKQQIKAFSNEIREFLIEKTSERGGHLASNLGVVELTLAIHSVFDSPKDRVIFDVGHQSYVHKILTGRREDFDSLRTPGGLSGFTKMSESSHDPFGAGHSSTSISAALGYARADALSGEKRYTVCVTGDGAFTGGMIHEALNNCSPELPMIIILNENGMSISTNQGAFASYLSKVRVSSGYRNFKSKTASILDHIPIIGRFIKNMLSLAKRAFKSLVYKPNYFEQLGLYYIGPIDGNDYDKVCKALSDAKATEKTCVVHLKTVKGKGYQPAESSPDGYHSVSSSGSEKRFNSVFSDKLIKLAEDDEKILAVTAAMGIGTGLDLFGERYPDRYFDVGIAESHALTFSAGLAAGGYKPFVAIYSTFLQRGYDSIMHDIALQKLACRIVIDRAGLAVGDGATHHGIFDVSFLSHIPGMIILAPASYDSLCSMTEFAAKTDTTIAIRYPNAEEQSGCIKKMRSLCDDVLSRASADFADGDLPEYIFITYGNIIKNVSSAAEMLRRRGMNVGVILVETLKPYDKTAEIILPTLLNAKRIIYVEEGIQNGGAAQLTREALIKAGFDYKKTEYIISAIDDCFASPTEKCDLYDYVGLSAEKLAEKMIN